MNKIKPFLQYFLTLGLGCTAAYGMNTFDYIKGIKTYDNVDVYALYEKNRVLPLEKIMDSIKPNSEKEKYRKWSQENIDFIKSLSTEEIKNKFNYLTINVKDGNNLFDRLLGKYLEQQKQLTENEKDALLTSKGMMSMLNYSINPEEVDKIVPQTIYFGMNSFNDPNEVSPIIKTLKTILKNDQQVFDFILLHELSHFLAYNYYNEPKKNALAEQNDLFESFVKQQPAKKGEVVHTPLDKKIIQTQYGETIADVMALQLLFKKYPDLLKKDILFNIAKIRNFEADFGTDHITYVGILYMKNYMKNKSLPNDLEGMLKFSKKSALVNAQYYSDFPFGFSNEDDAPESRKVLINLGVKYNEDIITNELEKLEDAVEKEKLIKQSNKKKI